MSGYLTGTFENALDKTMNEIPVLNGNGDSFQEDPGAFLEFGIKLTEGSSAFSVAPDRPYDGQPWTYNGLRGSNLVTGLTMRDISDCLIRAFLRCAPPELGLYDKVENGTYTSEDCYGWNLDYIDPIAVAQNLVCEIEKQMSIFPNVTGCPTSEEILDNMANPDNLIG